MKEVDAIYVLDRAFSLSHRGQQDAALEDISRTCAKLKNCIILIDIEGFAAMGVSGVSEQKSQSESEQESSTRTSAMGNVSIGMQSGSPSKSKLKNVYWNVSFPSETQAVTHGHGKR